MAADHHTPIPTSVAEAAVEVAGPGEKAVVVAGAAVGVGIGTGGREDTTGEEMAVGPAAAAAVVVVVDIVVEGIGDFPCWRFAVYNRSISFHHEHFGIRVWPLCRQIPHW